MASLMSIATNGPRDIEFEVIVVLNESDETSVSELTAAIGGVQFLESSVNLGLAGCANRGRAAASGELLIVLHDDAEVEEGWMEALVEAADTHPEAAVIGGKVLHFDGQLQNAGMILWREGNSSAPWIGSPPSPSAFNEVRRVDYCGTSSLLVRAELWDSIGGLDERFYPVYYVDVDLAMSARNCGWAVLYQPASRIRHHSGSSGTNRWRAFLGDRNRQLLIEKWGDALQQHEPAGDILAVRRAVDRAASWRPMPAETGDRTPPEAFSTCRRSDEFYRQKRQELSDEYAGWLTRRLDNVEHDLAIAESVRVQAQSELDALRAASVYLPGERLEFCERGSARRYQLSGGHLPEAWGQWLGNDPLTIVLPLAGQRAQTAAMDWTVRVEVVSFLSAERTNSSLTVTINGDVVVAVNETNPTPQTYEGRIKRRADWPAGQLVVQIQGTGATSPGLDTRLLSIGLISLTLEIDSID